MTSVKFWKQSVDGYEITVSEDSRNQFQESSRKVEKQLYLTTVYLQKVWELVTKSPLEMQPPEERVKANESRI